MNRSLRPAGFPWLFALGGLFLTGCQDGPLYALKTVNPYFTMKEWKADEDLGVTDHVRRQQLADLARTIGSMDAPKQTFWTDHLRGLIADDPNAEMRRLATLAAAGLSDRATALSLVERSLDDSVAKVRVEACQAVAAIGGDEALTLLTRAVNSESDLDVRQAAIAGLGRLGTPAATATLRRTLDDADPATTQLAIASLRRCVGRDLGDDPATWIAALDRGSTNAPTNVAAGDATFRTASSDAETNVINR